jgi:hypothetical protein
MAKTFTISTGAVTISAATTLVCIRPNTTTPIKVVRCTLSQRGTATSEQVRVQLGRKASAFATGLTAINVGGATQPLLAKHNETDPASSITGGTSAAAGTAGTASTSEGAGAFTPVVDDAFNNLTGYVWVPAPGEELMFAPASAEAFVLRVPTAPTGTTNWHASVTFEEI